LAIAAVWHPEVVLLDIWLQGMDGYEVARRLRTLPGDGRATIIAVSGHVGEEHVERAFAAGCDAYLAKPCDPDQLAAMIAPGADLRPRTVRAGR
jgi:two-component system CheB/CheR fusion protein